MKKILIIIVIISTSSFYGCVDFKNVQTEITDAEVEREIIKEEDRPIWEKKIISNQKLKMGIITDTQVHPSRVSKSVKGPNVLRYLKPRYGDAIDVFVEEMKIFQPDVIVVPGDIIEGTGDEDFVGVDGLQLVQDKLEKVGVPIIWVAGNHEVRSVTKKQYKEALGIDYLNKSFEFGDYRVIVIDGNFYPNDIDVVPGGKRYTRGHVSTDNIAFLDKELQTDKQTILFIHQPPLVGDDIKDRSPEGLLDNSDIIQKLLGKYNALTAIGGHIEYKRHIKKNGVDYYSLPGTIKSEAFPGAFYGMTIENGNVDTVMHYIDSVSGNYKKIDFEETKDKSGHDLKTAT